MELSIWSSPIWVPVGLGLGLLGIAAGIYFAWWFARGPGLCTQTSGTTLVSTPENERISVQYDGEPVARVAQSILWLWRTGRGAIRGTDVVELDPLAITVPDGSTILDIRVLRQTKPSNDVRTDFKKSSNGVKRVLLDFHHLDRGQGVAFEVFHTAASPDAVKVEGEVVGIPRGIRATSAGSTMRMPVGLVGSIAVTIPTGVIPRHLRGAGRQPRPLRDQLVEALIAALRSVRL